MKWSAMQEAIFKEVREGTSSIEVSATAGAGKSTTAIECLNRLPDKLPADFSVLLTSFGVQSIDDLSKKEPPWFVELRTMNSLGYRALFNHFRAHPKLNRSRVYSKIDEVVGRNTMVDPAAKAAMNGFRARVKTLVDFAKSYLVSTVTELDDLAYANELDTAVPAWLGREMKERFKCEPALAVATAAALVLEKCKVWDGATDFNDQLWLPVVLRLPIQKFDLVVVDEAQDTSPVQVELLAASMKPSARMFLFGESIQAIYAFRGAGIGMEPLSTRVKAKTLPLSISYRCPRLVVKEANKISPTMRAADDAIDGIVQSIPYDMLPTTVQVGDVVLSRKNAPLISLFMRFLKNCVPVGVQGKDLGGRLIRFVEDSGAKSSSELLKYTEEWAARERKRRTDKNPNAKTDAIDDHADCVKVLCEDTQSIDVVLQRIKDLLLADTAGRVVLSSVHRAKGLEFGRVFLIEESFPVCPEYWLQYAKKGNAEEWAEKKAAAVLSEETEERNIRYVAITRAKRELYFVR